MKLRLSRALYSEENVQAAALAVSRDAAALLNAGAQSFTITLKPKRRLSAAAGKALGGFFLNEALSHAYRQKVVRFNRDLSSAVMARFLAERFPPASPDPLEELEPQVRSDRQKEREDLLRAAQALEKKA